MMKKRVNNAVPPNNSYLNHRDIFKHAPQRNDAGLDLPLLRYDTGFATKGKLSFPGASDWASCVIPSQSSKGMFLATHYEAFDPTQPEKNYDARIVRFNSAGQIDLSFGPLGDGSIVAKFADRGISTLLGVHDVVSGEIYTWGAVVWLNDSRICSEPYVAKWKATGQPDTGFGKDGKLNLTELTPESPYFIDMPGFASSDNSLFFGLNNADANGCHVLKLTPSGKPDSQFGRQGLVLLAHPTDPNCITTANSLSPSSEGGVYVCGQFIGSESVIAFIMKIDARGDVDRRFGTNGVSEISVPELQPVIYNLNIEKGHSTLIAAGGTGSGPIGNQDSEKGLMTLFDPNGMPDKSFNNGLPVFHRFGSVASSWWFACYQKGQTEKVLAVGREIAGDVIGRFNSNGSVDESLVGVKQFATVNDAIFFGTKGLSIVNTTPTQILVAGYSDGSPAILAFKV